MNADHPSRRHLLAAGGWMLALGAGAGCASSPPLRLHHLPLAPPQDARAPVTAGAAWEVVMRTDLPAYLDRDSMLVDQGQGRIEALPGHRWAEPLADAVPRLLLHDLALLRGTSQVWPAPAPAAAGVAWRLRVALSALQAEPALQRLRLQSRWTLEGRSDVLSARAGTVVLNVPLAGGEASAIVQAHRLALWRLAEGIVTASAG